MQKMKLWILGGVAAVAVSGLAFAMPALAGDKAANNPMTSGMTMMQAGGDMSAMHNVMRGHGH